MGRMSRRIGSAVLAAVSAVAGFVAGVLVPRRRSRDLRRTPSVADAKERWLIAQVHSVIISGTFTERDVLELLILLRRHAPRRSPVLEFGDFVAHREKNRGIVREYMHRVQETLAGRYHELIRLPVFSVDDIRRSLNTLLHRFGLEELDPERSNQVVVCIIALLQSVVVETPAGRQIGGFAVAISTDQIILMGHGTVPAGHVFQFPLLIAANHGYESAVAKQYVEYPMQTDFVVRAYSTGGLFRCEQTLPRLPRTTGTHSGRDGFIVS